MRSVQAPVLLSVLLVLLIGAPIAFTVVWIGQQHAAGLLRQEAERSANAVSRALGQQLTRATDLGIPLAEIPGVESYLAEMLGRIPGLEGVMVRSAAGRLLFTTGAIDGAGSAMVTTPVLAGGREIGSVTVAASVTGAVTAPRRLYGSVALTVLIAALVAGLAAAVLIRYRLKPARQALVAVLERMAGGDFTPPSAPADRDAVGRSFESIAMVCESVNNRYRALLDRAEALRAIDFDGSLARRIDQVLKPLHQRFRFDPDAALPRDPRRKRWVLLLRSRVTLLVMLAAALLCIVLGLAGWQRESLLETRFARVSIDGQEALWRQVLETEVIRLRNLLPPLVHGEAVTRAIADDNRGALAALLGVSVRPLLVTGEFDEIDIVNSSGTILYSSFPGPDQPRILDAGSIDTVLRGGILSGLHRESARRYLLVVSFPIHHEFRVVGAGTVAMDAGRLVENFSRMLGAPGFLVSLRGRLVNGTEPALEAALPSFPSREASVQQVTLSGAIYSVTSVPIHDLSGGQAGLLVTFRDATDSLGQARRVTRWSLFGAGGFLLLVLIGLYLYLRGAFRPLEEAIAALQALARGDTSVRLEADRSDEIGRIAEAVRGFRRGAMALAEERNRHEFQRRRQERFIRKQMESLAAGLDTGARQELLADLQTLVDQHGQGGDPGDDQLGLLAGVLHQMSTRIVEQHRRLSTLVTELRDALVTKTKLAGLQQELEIAHQVQRAILPTTFPNYPDFEVHGHMVPAREVGGDFYDFFNIDEEQLGVVIADVSGKGVPAALFMAISRTLLKATALYERSPAACVARLNDLLAIENEQMMFVTLFYGVLHLPSGRLTYVNAGHNPPYVIGANGRLRALPSTGGMAVAVFEGQNYRQLTHAMAAGDTLFLYTDGVTEAFDADGQAFGETRLEALLAGRVAALGVPEIAEMVVEAIRVFERGVAQADDITCLTLRYRGQESELGETP